MERHDLSPDLGSQILELQRRIDTLERSPRAYAPGTFRDLQPRTRTFETTPVDTTSGSFATAWNMNFERITHLGFYVVARVDVGAATTGEVRLKISTDGASTYSLSRSFSTGVYQTWSVDMSAVWTVGYATTVIIGIESRRTAGANTVSVYVPDRAYLANLVDLTNPLPPGST